MGVETDRLAFASIRELGRMLRAGETTPTGLAEFFLDRLDTVGRGLNAVVTLTRERALDEARVAERELAAGHDRGPLHGIPYGAKDLCATAPPYPTSWGAAPLRDQQFAHDATAIARLRGAGAVLVAKLAMVELAGGMGYDQPDAAFTGPGINPWRADAWSGGSSSGSGSAVGSGAVPFAIGSETVGSIVTPASFCGVSGLRPTYGRVSRHGAMALSWTLDKLGPMARTADDCGLVLAAMAGHDPADETSLTAPYRYTPKRERVANLRLAVPEGATENVQGDVGANFRAALDQLGAIATIEEIALPDFPYGPVVTAILDGELASAFDDFIASGKVAELTAPEDRVGGYGWRFMPAKDYVTALRIRRAIRHAWDDLLARYDGIMAPATAVVASPLDVRFSDYFPRDRRHVLTQVGNIIGAPAISVPNGFGERGLPTGLQILGRAGAENTVLAIARAYQGRTDWHERRPTLAGG
ncbi:MAG: Glutamyl-tRNA(Gln) amidotransferase subunit A-like protein [uncultured Thermomicrobiales bacterium]|uniref:Glutamyl-tRNA(Gln) amidotransferase subunit A-like protein n=1 Tax=uncultured Thermomicrobiales bacterium TaxID=1645740 RepID=A0A6J4VLY2_9BACT|nr:MAG: Glutamyl-tRNA(Gln) amidotransferase subunit A-like protein [uncultured Thermomicrobiales bacterium]